MKTLSDDIRENGTKQQIGSTPHEKPNYGNTFLNHLIVIKKNDSNKTLLHVRHLNSTTDPTSESWPLEPLATHLGRANKNYKSAFARMYANAYATLDDETIKVTEFLSGGTFFGFIRRLCRL